MSDFRKGDKVMLNDAGFRVIPKGLSAKEHRILAGVLTISDVLRCPTLEDPESQALWVDEICFTVPSAGVDKWMEIPETI